MADLLNIDTAVAGLKTTIVDQQPFDWNRIFTQHALVDAPLSITQQYLVKRIQSLGAHGLRYNTATQAIFEQYNLNPKTIYFAALPKDQQHWVITDYKDDGQIYQFAPLDKQVLTQWVEWIVQVRFDTTMTYDFAAFW